MISKLLKFILAIASILHVNVAGSLWQRVAVPIPGGATKITANYLDRRVKSVTGTSVVAEFYDYDLADGTVPLDAPYPKNITTVTSGSTNSARWKQTVTDCAGKLMTELYPGVSTVLRNTYGYNVFADLTVAERPAIDVTSTNQLGRLATYFSADYASLSSFHLQRVDLDQCGTNANLTLDRINATDTFYTNLASGWFKATKQWFYRLIQAAKGLNP